jgi:hypothetical protein
MTGGAGSVDQSGGNGNDSSESETENNDDLGTSVKFLLLVHFIRSISIELLFSESQFYKFYISTRSCSSNTTFLSC